jgi:membrane associated rhomboid family serine protease
MIPVKNRAICESFPWITVLIFLINIAVFVYELTLSEQELKQFFNVFGLVPEDLTGLQINYFNNVSNIVFLPLITGLFIHGGFFHILFNLWTLYLFGPCVEDRMGHMKYLFFYLLCGVGSSVIHAVIHSASSVPTVGASGAIAGILGAYFVILPFSRIVVMFPLFFIPLFFEIPAFVYLLIWFVSQLHNGTWILIGGVPEHGGIAFWAHISGFLIGLFLLRLFCFRDKRI